MDRDLFQIGYGTFGNWQNGVSFSVPNLAPSGLVPNNAEDGLAPSALLTSTSIKSNLEVANGAIWANKQDFNDFLITNKDKGYRLGIERNTQIAKFIIGDNTNALLWDGATFTIGDFTGNRIVISPTIAAVSFFNASGISVGLITAGFGGSSTAMLIDASDVLIIEAKNSIAFVTNGVNPGIKMVVDDSTNIVFLTVPIRLAQYANIAAMPVLPFGSRGALTYDDSVSRPTFWDGAAWINL